MLCLIHFWLLRKVQCAGPKHISSLLFALQINTHTHTRIYIFVFNNFLTDDLMNLWNTLFCSHRYVDNFLLHTLQVKRSLGTPRGFAAPLGVFQAFNSPTETHLIWMLPLSRSPRTSLSSYPINAVRNENHPCCNQILDCCLNVKYTEKDVTL